MQHIAIQPLVPVASKQIAQSNTPSDVYRLASLDSYLSDGHLGSCAV